MSRGFFEVKAKANIGKIEVNTLPSGDAVANVSLAATKYYTDSHGQKHEKTTWMSGTAYRRTAELLDQLTQQGTEIFLTGSLNVDPWVDQNQQERKKVEIIIDSFDVLRRGRERQGAQGQPNTNRQGQGHQQGNNGYNQAPQGNGYNQAPQNNANNHPPQNNAHFQPNNGAQNYQRQGYQQR